MAKGAKEEEYFKTYEEYSRTLRTWFVAYGIGGPALFLTNEAAATALKASSEAKCVALLFLAGVALQIVLASVNKFSMWVLYCGESDSIYQTRRAYKAADWISEQFWIDVVIDLATLAVFALAAWKVFVVILGT